MNIDSHQPDAQEALPAAPFLFLDMDDSKDNDPKAPGTVFTGERLLRNHPEVYREIVRLLGQGVGVREIVRRVGCHHRTVQAVAIREGQTIDALRKELGARALGVAGLAMEAFEERVMSGGVKPAELVMGIGILVDKGQVLTGGVTGRVERVERHEVEKDLDAILVGVEVIEDKNIGLGLGENSQREGSVSGGCDSESIVFDGCSIVGNDVATGSATGEGSESSEDLADEGEGGGRNVQGGVETNIDMGSGNF